MGPTVVAAHPASFAYETDILEYPDIFEGSKVMDGLVEELLEGAREEMAIVAEHGGAVQAVPT